MSLKIILKGIKVFVAVLCLAMVGASTADVSNTLGSFTKCLKTRGATFYGAFWCPYCQKQKEMFGESQKFLPYNECSTRGTKSEQSACKGKKIRGFPTWVFADGSRLEGELPFEVLAKKTGCKLPSMVGGTEAVRR